MVGVKLRHISYADSSGDKHTVFVGMTDAEFKAFRASNKPSLGIFKDRIVHTVDGLATEADQENARTAFAHRFGSRADKALISKTNG
jgi:hypothetical protein